MRYENHLPPEVKHLRRGRALVIQSPREFRAWLEAGGPKAGGFWARLLGR